MRHILPWSIQRNPSRLQLGVPKGQREIPSGLQPGVSKVREQNRQRKRENEKFENVDEPRNPGLIESDPGWLPAITQVVTRVVEKVLEARDARRPPLSEEIEHAVGAQGVRQLQKKFDTFAPSLFRSHDPRVCVFGPQFRFVKGNPGWTRYSRTPIVEGQQQCAEPLC